MKKIFKWVGIIIGLLIVVVVLLQMIGGGGDPALVGIVKNGNIQMCPQHTVDRLADSFMASPSWESVKADDGNEYVNIRGGITLQGKPVDAAMQFAVDRETGAFTFNAFELNGIPQNQIIQAELIAKMCASAGQ